MKHTNGNSGVFISLFSLYFKATVSSCSLVDIMRFTYYVTLLLWSSSLSVNDCCLGYCVHILDLGQFVLVVT